MPENTATAQPDSAPWWVKEIRPYGLTGIAALALAWFGWNVYENGREDQRESATRQERQFDKLSDVTERNTMAFQQFNATLQKNTEVLSTMNRKLEDK